MHILGSGRLSVSWSRMFLKSGQFALQKFYLFSGIVCCLNRVYRGDERRACCEHEKRSITSRLSKGPSRLTKARSGLVVVHYRGDQKLSGCLDQ